MRGFSIPVEKTYNFFGTLQFFSICSKSTPFTFCKHEGSLFVFFCNEIFPEKKVLKIDFFCFELGKRLFSSLMGIYRVLLAW